MKVLPWLGSGGTTLHQEQLAIRVWNGMLSKNGEIEAKGSPEVVFRIVFEDASGSRVDIGIGRAFRSSKKAEPG